MSEYLKYISNKAGIGYGGNAINPEIIHSALFPFQSDVLRHLLSIGRSAAFCDTGLGKTIIQCEWANHIPGEVLIIAPLAVAKQTQREARKLLGMDMEYSRSGEVNGKVTITNYEMVEHFDCSRFAGVVLDESSILKGQSSKTRTLLTELFKQTPYKLACTATPAPNDYTELGNHAEFLGHMTQQEMLSRWFVHDSANTQDWRLKGHAVKPFWQWVASWAACVSKPSDLGYDDSDYELPKLTVTTHKVDVETETAFDQGMLFDVPQLNATSLHKQKRASVHDRVALAADMVNNSKDQWLVWCESNQESELLKKAIPDSVEVKGSDKADHKEDAMLGFSDGKYRVLVSKSSICGFGMNWQNCNKIAFASISYSYERFYQAIRRSWRFGQKKPVDVHVVIADAETPVWRAIERKALDHDRMKEHMKWAVFNLNGESHKKIDYMPNHTGTLPRWLIETAQTELAL
jgi:hypothetical protein